MRLTVLKSKLYLYPFIPSPFSCRKWSLNLFHISMKFIIFDQGLLKLWVLFQNVWKSLKVLFVLLCDSNIERYIHIITVCPKLFIYVCHSYTCKSPPAIWSFSLLRKVNLLCFKKIYFIFLTDLPLDWFEIQIQNTHSVLLVTNGLITLII